MYGRVQEVFVKAEQIRQALTRLGVRHDLLTRSNVSLGWCDRELSRVLDELAKIEKWEQERGAGP